MIHLNVQKSYWEYVIMDNFNWIDLIDNDSFCSRQQLKWIKELNLQQYLMFQENCSFNTQDSDHPSIFNINIMSHKANQLI